MGKFTTALLGVALIAVGVVTGQPWLVSAGIGTTLSGLSSALLTPGAAKRRTGGTQVQIGEVPRQGMFGQGATGGSLVDAFNYGGKYGTDWTVLVIALADHKCNSLSGFYVYNTYVAFAGDGMVAGYNNQLQVYFRDGSYDQAVPSILTTNAPDYPAGHPLAGTKTWTTDDRGRGVAYVVVAYKADDPKSKHPVWSSGQPTFVWQLKGLEVYSAREDDTVGGSGVHRWDDDSTRAWSENLTDCRYTWVRGIYVEGHVDDPQYLLLGRGLSAKEAPPANVFAAANLCDEDVTLAAGGSEKRYRVGGAFGGEDSYIETEKDFAAACGGTIVDREGSVELLPGAAEAAVWSITDADLVEQTKVTARDFRSKTDSAWVNMVSAVYTEPTQKWATHAAPLRRDLADVAADGEPRIGQPQLKLVTSGTQAQRVGEMIRRKGRLWKTRSAVLPPRLAGVEHGDWLVWTSQRYGPRGAPGTPVTYRVVSDGQGQDWRNSVTLEEISAEVFDWSSLDELTPTGEAIENPAPPDGDAPDGGDWSLTGTTLSAGGTAIPALVIEGVVGDDYADAVVFDYRLYTGGLGDEDGWIASGTEPATVTRKEITSVSALTEYQASVRYRVRGIVGDRLILGPTTSGDLALGVRYLVSKTVNFPLSSDDTSISIAAFDGVASNGLAISFPAGSLTSLSSATDYAMLWDIEDELYLAVEWPATSYMASPDYVFLGRQATSNGGVYDDPEPPPPGYCVADDTPILLADGSELPAGDIEPGMRVRTRHERTMAWGDYEVAAISFHDEAVFACSLNGPAGDVVVRATAKHRFLIAGRWVCADELGTPDDTARVAKITVSEAHTYVSAGVISHNAKATYDF